MQSISSAVTLLPYPFSRKTLHPLCAPLVVMLSTSLVCEIRRRYIMIVKIFCLVAQVAAFLAGLHHSNKFRPSIVVCPATVLRQWLRELRCWYPPFRVAVLHDSQRTGHLPRPSRECDPA